MVVEVEACNLSLCQHQLAFPLTAGWAAPLAKQPCARMHIVSAHLLVIVSTENVTSIAAVSYFAVVANVALPLYHLLHMLEDVPARSLALVQVGGKFAVNFVPGTANIAAQKAFQGAQHISEIFAASIVVGLEALGPFRLFFVVVTFNVGQAGAKLLVAYARTPAGALNYDFFHVGTHKSTFYSFLSFENNYSAIIAELDMGLWLLALGLWLNQKL